MSQKLFLLHIAILLVIVILAVIDSAPRTIVLTDATGGMAQQSVSGEHSPAKVFSIASRSPTAAEANASGGRRLIEAGATVWRTDPAETTNPEPLTAGWGQVRVLVMKDNPAPWLVWRDAGADEARPWAVDYRQLAVPDLTGPPANRNLQGPSLFVRDSSVLNSLYGLLFEGDAALWTDRLRPVPFVTGRSALSELAASAAPDPIIPALLASGVGPSAPRDGSGASGQASTLLGQGMQPPTSPAVDHAGGGSHISDGLSGRPSTADVTGGNLQDLVPSLTVACSVVSVPEPALLVLLSLGGLAVTRRRRQV